MLTRDARVKERKKYGLKAARRAPHSPNVNRYIRKLLKVWIKPGFSFKF